MSDTHDPMCPVCLGQAVLRDAGRGRVMSDTPTPAQLRESITALRDAARPVMDFRDRDPHVMALHRGIDRLEQLELERRAGAEALETLEKVKEWCREFNVRLFEFPSTGDTCSWCHAESNEGRHRSNCPKTLLLAAIDGS